MKKFLDGLGREFYKHQGSAIPPCLEDTNIHAEFAFWGWLNDKLYSFAKLIFSFYSQKRLKELDKISRCINSHNCDFRIYEMKEAIKHGIFCNLNENN